MVSMQVEVHRFALKLNYSSNFVFRVFALANKMDDLDFEQRSMAGLLAKFRIDYSSLKLLPDITKKPSDSTSKFFEDLVNEFSVAADSNEEGNKY